MPQGNLIEAISQLKFPILIYMLCQIDIFGGETRKGDNIWNVNKENILKKKKQNVKDKLQKKGKKKKLISIGRDVPYPCTKRCPWPLVMVYACNWEAELWR